MESPRWHVCSSAAEVSERAVAWIGAAARQAIAAHGVFRIVLSGGETPRSVYRALRALETDWSAWQIWFGDERCLAADDPPAADAPCGGCQAGQACTAEGCAPCVTLTKVEFSP